MKVQSQEKGKYSFIKRLSLAEVRTKYGVCAYGASSMLGYYLLSDGRVIDSTGDIRYIPQL